MLVALLLIWVTVKQIEYEKGIEWVYDYCIIVLAK
jgi:hypothetical protein